MPTLPRLLQVVAGCVVLGLGVAMLLTADLGSDGFSTLVHGLSIGTGIEFWLANALVSATFLVVAAVRKVRPGIGTAIQVAVVGGTVSMLLDAWPTPASWPGRIVLLLLAFPVLATGIAAYLGSRTGAGPAEAAALAWDPPVPFKWSYSAVQFGGALGGWLLGATIGAGTVLVILLLGPMVDLAARLLRQDVHQG